MRHPGDYLERRMGVGRQDWDACDQTPCRCSPRTKRLVKKKARQFARRDVAERAVEWDKVDDATAKIMRGMP